MLLTFRKIFQDANGMNQQSDAGGNGCDLNNLEESLCNDSDELLRQLTENTFELEQFFQDFPVTEIKVVIIIASNIILNRGVFD